MIYEKHTYITNLRKQNNIITKHMAQLTAMRFLINTSESIKNLDPKVQLMILRGEMQALLPTEEKQIVDAVYAGMESHSFDPNRGRAQEYYNQTYKNEDPAP